MSEIIENYLQVGSEYGPIEFKEKGSRFISYAFPVKSVDEANEKINSTKKKYYDCTHVCSAFIIGNGVEDLFRYSDDGEPSGTAGLPIYNEIKGASLFNTLITVIRYYGGTKLGTGGLTRAYGGSAKLIIKEIKPQKVHVKKRFIIKFPYNFTGNIMNICEKNSIDIISQQYLQEGVKAIINIPIKRVKEINELFIYKSGGKIKLLSE